MMDNDYESYFGAPTSSGDEKNRQGVYSSEPRFLHQSQRERPSDTSTFSVAMHRNPSTASSVAGWTVTSQLVLPQMAPHGNDGDDQEASSNFNLGGVGRDYSIYDLPVYDTDDGGYTDVSLEDGDEEEETTSAPTTSKKDPQLIVIKNKEKDGEEDDDKPRRTCLSRLCYRFMA